METLQKILMAILLAFVCVQVQAGANKKSQPSTPLQIAEQKDKRDAKVWVDKAIKTMGLSKTARRGMMSLANDAVKARAEMRRTKAKTAGGWGKSQGVFLADSIPIEFALKTVLVEHTGSASPDQINSVLEKLAQNPKHLAKIKSPVKARGPMQAMPKTYKAITKRRPEIKLEKSFDKGASDTVNAMKFSFALADEDKKCLGVPAHGKGLKTKELHSLAAAYNGGCNRGKQFAKGKQIPKETRGYVAKHKRIDDAVKKAK